MFNWLYSHSGLTLPTTKTKVTEINFNIEIFLTFKIKNFALSFSLWKFTAITKFQLQCTVTVLRSVVKKVFTTYINPSWHLTTGRIKQNESLTLSERRSLEFYLFNADKQAREKMVPFLYVFSTIWWLGIKPGPPVLEIDALQTTICDSYRVPGIWVIIWKYN